MTETKNFPRQLSIKHDAHHSLISSTTQHLPLLLCDDIFLLHAAYFTEWRKSLQIWLQKSHTLISSLCKIKRNVQQQPHKPLLASLDPSSLISLNSQLPKESLIIGRNQWLLEDVHLYLMVHLTYYCGLHKQDETHPMEEKYASEREQIGSAGRRMCWKQVKASWLMCLSYQTSDPKPDRSLYHHISITCMVSYHII